MPAGVMTLPVGPEKYIKLILIGSHYLLVCISHQAHACRSTLPGGCENYIMLILYWSHHSA